MKKLYDYLTGNGEHADLRCSVAEQLKHIDEECLGAYALIPLVTEVIAKLQKKEKLNEHDVNIINLALVQNTLTTINVNKRFAYLTGQGRNINEFLTKVIVGLTVILVVITTYPCISPDILGWLYHITKCCK
jgi:hypothetical protein